MTNQCLTSQFGYEIPCTLQESGAAKTLLICHGFGSSKESPTVQALLEAMPRQGVDTVSFDFPCHGDSPADCTCLRVACCLADLRTVEEDLLRRAEKTEVVYFGSSFGAYIVLLHLALSPHAGKRAFLRSAAIDMYGIVEQFLQDDRLFWQSAPDNNPLHDICDMETLYGRGFSITRAFVEDLRQHQVLDLYPNNSVSSLVMVHGALDSTASLTKAEDFALRAGANLLILPGCEHRLMEPSTPETVLQHLSKWL